MRFLAGFAGAVLLLTAAGAAAPAPEGGAPLAAVWKEQRLKFVYMGRTARYSCDGLRDKIRGMLLDLGARRDLRITTVSCDDSAPGTLLGSVGPSIALTFSSPALPDAGAQPPHRGDLGAVDARFEQFTIGRDVFRNMDIGDCELVQQFARQVLPKLAARGIKEDITCVPNQPSGSRFLVRGEVLRALPSPSNAPRPTAP